MDGIEPALARHAALVGQVAAEELEMRRAPGGDVLVIAQSAMLPQTTRGRTSGNGCRVRRTSRGSSTSEM